MSKYICWLGQLIIGFSALFIGLKMGSIYMALLILCIGIAIYVYGKIKKNEKM